VLGGPRRGGVRHPARRRSPPRRSDAGAGREAGARDLRPRPSGSCAPTRRGGARSRAAPVFGRDGDSWRNAGDPGRPRTARRAAATRGGLAGDRDRTLEPADDGDWARDGRQRAHRDGGHDHAQARRPRRVQRAARRARGRCRPRTGPRPGDRGRGRGTSRHPRTVRLEGKVAIVTGAAGGIGSAVAAALAREGARLTLVDRDERTVTEVAARLGDVLVRPADGTGAADVERYVEATVGRFGRLDVLFNNAGIAGEVKPIIEADESVFDQVLAVNLRGVWLNLRYALRAMDRAGNGGSIVNTSSALGLRGRPGHGPSAATQHAAHGR